MTVGKIEQLASTGAAYKPGDQIAVLMSHNEAALRQRIAQLEPELAEARKDNEELDGTDAAHPAWWRGNDAGVAQVCAQINAILDGADVSGTASEPWEPTRRRVAEARKDSERLTYIIDRSNNGEGWLCDSVWDEAPYIDECTNGQLSIRAAIDAARGTK